VKVTVLDACDETHEHEAASFDVHDGTLFLFQNDQGTPIAACYAPGAWQKCYLSE
jgi:hypothetical protein